MQGGLFSNPEKLLLSKKEGGKGSTEVFFLSAAHRPARSPLPAAIKEREAKESGDQLAVLWQWKKRGCKPRREASGKGLDLRSQEEVDRIRGVRMRESRFRRKD